MNKIITALLILVVVCGGAYYLYINNSKPAVTPENVATSTETDTANEVCDAKSNRYKTEADAKSAGLAEAEYGATYCPEYVAAQTGDYTGLTSSKASEIAQARGEVFRVVEIDGVAQPTTRDFMEGRINATITNDVVTAYTIETNTEASTTAETSTPMEPITKAEIIGKTVVVAEAYAKTKGVDFRVGTVDGVANAVTADFRVGRITAEVKNGVVVSYSVEK